MKQAICIQVAVEGGVVVNVIEVEMSMSNTLWTLAVEEEEDAAVKVVELAEVVELAAAVEDRVVVEDEVVVEDGDGVVMEVEEFKVKRVVAILMQMQEYQRQQSTIMQKIKQTKQAVEDAAQQKAKIKQQHQNGLVV